MVVLLPFFFHALLHANCPTKYLALSYIHILDAKSGTYLMITSVVVTAHMFLFQGCTKTLHHLVMSCLDMLVLLRQQLVTISIASINSLKTNRWSEATVFYCIALS